MNATGSQLKLIEDMLSTNQLYTGRYDRLWKRLEMARIAHQADAIGIERDGCHMSSDDADSIWAWLNRAHRAGTLRQWV